MDDLLREFPVLDGIWACDELVFRCLDFINAKVAKSIIWIFGLIRMLAKGPICSLGDVQI